MKNFVYGGRHFQVAGAPYAAAAGAGMLVGSLFGVASVAIASGGDGVICTQGVFTLVKLSGEAWTQGAKIYWDNTNKRCTTTSSGNTLIGVAAKAEASGHTLGDVRLGIVA